MYRKRAGTSGICGALFETKLLSLLYFRAIHDDDIENFQLLSNVENLGEFDDICFTAKVKGFNKPVAVFIQAKHRGNGNRTIKIDLANYFKSYMKIKQAFHWNKKDLFIGRTFNETECLFVLYTNAKTEFSDDSVESLFSAKLKNLIDTRNKISGSYELDRRYEENKNYRIISVEDQVTALAKWIAKFITGKDDFRIMLTDENVLRYHVILAQKVFDVSEIQAEGYRMASFRYDFFDTNEEYLILFKDTLFKEILNRRKIKPADIQLFLSEFLDNPTDVKRLSKLIGTVIKYNNGQLEFDKQSIKDFKADIKPMDVSRSTVDKAVELAAKEILSALHFKVPVAFGNKDLTINDSDAIQEIKIHYLAAKIKQLLRFCNSSKMVTIDASLDVGFLQLNGGIAGAIGNIFVLDDNNTLLKITDNVESLGTLANTLYSILNSEIQNLHEYRFCFKGDKFPKLSFESIQTDLRDTTKHPYKFESNIEHLIKVAVKDQVTSLAERIAMFVLSEQNFQLMLTDENVLRYHVILAQKVFDVSEIQSEGYRMASFRYDFFDTNEEYLILFKDTLFKEILNRRKIKPADIQLFLSEYLDNPTDVKRLSKLIGTVIKYNNGQLEFDKQSIKDFKSDIKPMDISRSTVDKAVELAVKEILASLQFKVPVAFGNKDLTISGNDAKIERRIKYLVWTICDLLHSCNSSKIVTIGEPIAVGFLQLNGGIGGAIGNIFVLDDSTKLMKITDNWESLGNLAKRLYTKLIDEIHDLHDYKFSFRVDKFPRLSFGEYEENLVRDFLNKLLIYSNQADEKGVEEILKVEIIEKYQHKQPHYFQVQTDAIFAEYHNKIQEWWMQPYHSRSLTRESDLFRHSINNIFKDVLINSINLMSMKKLQQYNYTFTEDAVRSLNLQDHQSGTVIVAEITVLTVVKVIQHLKNRPHVVLDLEYIATLPMNDQNALRSELASTFKGKVLIFVCDKIESRSEVKIVEDIAEAVRNETTIIITKETSLEIIKRYFPKVDILHDKKLRLIDLSKKSQKSIFETAITIFPGGKIRLDHLLRGWPTTGIRRAAGITFTLIYLASLAALAAWFISCRLTQRPHLLLLARTQEQACIELTMKSGMFPGGARNLCVVSIPTAVADAS